MDDDPRIDFACRMGMLAAAILHWVAAGLMIWNQVQPSATWDHSQSGRHFASAILERIASVL